MNSKQSALSGVRIIELAEGVAGEYCGKLLADFDAEVIKVERPAGSPVRSLSPLAADKSPEGSAFFAYLNTNKKSVVLDIETAQGRALLRQLVETADVVMDDHAPGWLRDHDLEFSELQAAKPDLIVCSITPYGQCADEDIRHGEDLNVFHASGWGYHTPGGNDGSQVLLKGAGRYLVSYEAGVDAALCIVAARYAVECGGMGRLVDIAKKRVMYSRLDYVLAAMLAGDMDVREDHVALDLGGPASILPCRDGFVYVWLSDEPMWCALREMIGDAPWMDVDFPFNWLQEACTPDRVARTRKHLTAWLADKGKHEISEAAQRVGVMIVPINNPEDLLASPQFQFRKFFTEVRHPVLGVAQYPTVPYKMSRTPAEIRSPAPLLGEHSDMVISGTGESL